MIVIADYDDAWPGLFARLGAELRALLGDEADRIDHIGSTSIPGLAAKPIIDVQISVPSLDHPGFVAALTEAGFVYRSGNPELTKRYFRERPGARRTHIHVRGTGSFSEQFALLFRDHLRLHPADAREYEQVKRRLAVKHAHDRQAYVEEKSGIVWDIIRRADGWAQATGWSPGPSDA
ncbi:GrpB domain, predicted nucleotidyltransferase, UPF0157 family [Nonomuraea solani]|uniref:GrpB domain, predicted nucleotidyltransferase, UPF0157 family n=1 Tax=Nonomuraea solani TaxID=1144553 RepID=A0A1H6ET01_9ACTN|nr:GrpB family protein [Nonomuraea solani]SEH00136.1 GrpB domain, predicted nucleotidyltransferase, UPF0157 family [Nonomuraea solani]